MTGNTTGHSAACILYTPLLLGNTVSQFANTNIRRTISEYLINCMLIRSLMNSNQQSCETKYTGATFVQYISVEFSPRIGCRLLQFIAVYRNAFPPGESAENLQYQDKNSPELVRGV